MTGWDPYRPDSVRQIMGCHCVLSCSRGKRLLHAEILPEATDIKSRCFFCFEFCNDSIF